MVKRAKLLGIISAIHFTLGVFSTVLGIVALKVAPYYHGVFGMGIWLGVWMLVTGVVGLLTASDPTNLCRLGGFIGCSLVGSVSMFVSSIILGVGIIGHFKFEATVDREYYRAKGIGYESVYTKPQQYFDERNQVGKNGLGIYGTLLAIILAEIITNLVACVLCKEIVKKTQANTPPRRPSRSPGRQSTRQARPFPVFTIQSANHPYSANSGQPFYCIPNGFPVPTMKLPSYGELYPDVANPSQPVLQLDASTTTLETSTDLNVPVPSDPPPAYTP